MSWLNTILKFQVRKVRAKILEMLLMKEIILTLIQIIQHIIISFLPCKSGDMLFNIQKIPVQAKIQFLQKW